MQYSKIISSFCMMFCASLFILTSVNSYAQTLPIQPIETTASEHTDKISINTATAQELANALNGVGINKAQQIIKYRETYGPFIAIDQLKEVSGIGQSILDKNIDKLML